MEGIQARVNLEVFKEPRGFIKILEFVFSICAFATTVDFSTYFSFGIYCSAFDDEANVTITGEITYPFQIDTIRTPYSACGDDEKNLYVKGDFSSDAKFFVAVGVLAFLYVIVAIGLYCFFNALYENKDIVPKGDLIIHGIFVLLWLAASCAWVSSLTALSSAAKLDHILTYNNDLCERFTCKKIRETRFVKLIFSDIFGFLNVFIWAGNIWFLYKETSWYKEKNPTECPDIEN